MAETYKWAVMGPGTIARLFCSDLKRAKGAELRAVGSSSRERAERFAREFSVDRAYGSYEQLLADGDIDVVYVSTVNTKHTECVKAALQAGKAVLCEKPLGMSAVEARAVFALAREKNCFLMEALWTRFLPAYQRMMQWISEGRIGEVRRVTADFAFAAAFDPKSRLFDPALGGGSILDLGSYILGLAHDVFGALPEHTSSTVYVGSSGVDETVSLTLEFGRGRLANLYCSVRCPTPHSAFVYGSEGYIHLPDFWRATSAYLYREDQRVDALEHPQEGRGYEYEAMAVMECLRQGRITCAAIPPEQSFALAEAIDEVRASA